MYRRNAWVLEMQFHPGLHEGVDVRTDDFLRTKISWIHRLPNFLTHGAPLRAFRVRESSAISQLVRQKGDDKVVTNVLEEINAS